MKLSKAVLLQLLLLLFSQLIIGQKNKVTPTPIQDALVLNGKTVGYPVAPFRDTLFFIYQKIGVFSPKKRAEAITNRMVQIASDPLFEIDSLHVVQSDLSFDVLYKADFIITSVTSSDAKIEGKEAEVVASERKAIIGKAIVKELSENEPLKWVKRIATELLIIACVVLLLYVIYLLFRKFMYFLVRNDERFFKGVLLNNYHILSPKNQLYFTLKAIKFIRFLTYIFIIYLSLPVLFSVFPSTVGYTAILIQWIMKPAKFVLVSFYNYLPDLFTSIVIIVFFHYLIKVFRFFVFEIQKGNIVIHGFYSDWAIPTFNIIRVLLYAFMLVILFPYLPGSDSPIFKGVSVFIGVLFSIGSSNAIANMVAGLVITYMRPFKTGDFIKIGDVSGEVIEKTALVVRLRTPKMEDITIPNATILSSSSINFSSNCAENKKGLVVHSTVTIGYDVPWRDVHTALLNAAKRCDLLATDPAPFVLQTSLDDFYVSYEINAFTKEPTKQPLLYSTLHQNIQDCFFEAGIEIMSPHYTSLRDGNQTTIPESYLPNDYAAPNFKIQTANNK